MPISEDARVVVTGVGLVTALGLSASETWERCVRGESGIRPLSLFDPAGHACSAAAPAPDFDVADALRIPKNRKYMGRSALCCVRAGGEALRASRLDPSRIEAERIGVYVGSGETGLEYGEFFRALSFAWRDAEDRDFKHLGGRASRLLDPYFSIRTLANVGVAFLSTELGARGPGVNFVHSDTASAFAIASAVGDLRAGRCDVAIAGGHDSLVHESAYLGYEDAGLLSRLPPERAYRPFDVDRDGIVLGEGAAFLVLERERDARAREAPVLGEIAGFAAGMGASDEREPKCSEPVVRGAVEEALGGARASFVIAHGIGTVEGDARESSMLASIFGAAVPVTALKSQTGYVGAATAAVELAIGFSCLEHGRIPPIARHLRADPACPLDLVCASPRGLDGERPAFVSLAWSWGGQVSAIHGRAAGAPNRG